VSTPDPAGVYRQEAADLLEQLEHDLLSLERQPANMEIIDSVFRALHTIKGSGAMYGFDRVAAFTHRLETAFDAVRKGQFVPTPPLIAVTLEARDHIRRLIEEPEATDEAAGAAILARLDAVPSGDAVPEASGATTWRLHIRLPLDAMANGTNPLLLLDELRALGPCEVVAETDAIPSLDLLQPSDCHVRWRVTLTTEAPRSTIEQVFLFVIDDMQLDIEAVGPAAPPPAGAALPPGLLPDIARGDSRVAENNIRVPAERLDELMDRVGELVITQSRLKQVASTGNDPQVKAIAEEIERLVLELRDTTMGVRMVPILQLFGRFRRLVRDLAIEVGKQIELVTIGEDTELDKTMIERLNDPLVHLVRNAVDHGLEKPEVRTANGKPATGRVTLAARHAGHEVLISVRDDGRGLDYGRIRARAEDHGLIQPNTKMPDAELVQLLFHPGFSTAAQVTNLSGRGVGLDVVKRTIEQLRGTIDVGTDGAGTIFTMRLPLTLAIIDGLLVRVGSGRYVIPLSMVEECVELETADDERSHGRSFLNLRGTLVPYIRLRTMFGTAAPADRYQKVVIVSSGELRVGLVVDQVIGDHQTVIKSLSRLHAGIGTFSGATILGDGTVALILEIGHLVEAGQMREKQLQAVT
jgi:two-component system chemotaxis sensor kinase CheA